MANTSPAGVNQNIQFNNNGSFGANAAFNFDTGTGTLYVDNLSVGPGVLNAETRIVTGGDITPYTTGQNLGSVDNRWYNLYVDGGVYASGSFGTQNQILISDGYGTVKWIDPAQIALLAANSQSQIVDLLARFTANSNYANIHYLFGIEETQNTTLTTIQTSIQDLYAYANGISTGGNSVDLLARNIANTASANTIYIVGVNNTQNNSILVLNAYANAAFEKANSASANTIYTQGVDATQNTHISAVDAYATGAYGKANAANVLAQAAFNTANTASNNITILQGVDSYQNTRIAAVDAYGTGAYGKANAANVLAQSAFDKANTASANTVYTQGVDATQNTNIIAVDTYATGAYDKANAANVLAQAAFAYANTIAGGGTAIDQYARNTANTASNNIIILQGVNTTQNTNIVAVDTYATGAYGKANAANVLAQAAFDTANTSSANTIYLQGVDNQQNTNISGINAYSISAFSKANSANSLAQAAFDRANTVSSNNDNKVSKSGDTITGIINITNTTNSNTYNTGALIITGGVGVGSNIFTQGIFANNYYGTFDGGEF